MTTGTLEKLLQPVDRLLNRSIRASTPARALCRRLDGRTVDIRVRDTDLVACFIFSEDRAELASGHEGEADVVITGSLLALLSMNNEDSLRDGAVELAGDAATAKAFQQLLSHAKPDFEEELSKLVGDVAAHQLGEMARGAGRWARETRATIGNNLREYLQEESRNVPSRYDVEQFSRQVYALRDDVDRLTARIDRLRRGSEK